MTTPTNNPTMKPTTNLLETAAAKGHYKTFGKAVEKAGLQDTLRGAGPFTIFAPTDSAFEKLPSGRLETLFKPENKKELASIVNYHVISGRRSADELGKWQTAKTVNGSAAPIKLVDNKVTIDGARVTESDIDSTNGVMHGIDKVNMPAASTARQ